jgi:hypothetical protein
MKTLIVMMGLLMGGVALAAPPLEPGPCGQVAIFAKSIATLAASGIPEDQLENYISTTKVQTFPITLIRHRVYSESMNPAQAYETFNNICLAIGYTNIVQFITNEDERIKEQEENVQLRTQIARQHQQIIQLQSKITNQPAECPEQHKVIAYGSPIEN